jgi:hypothetical protein
MPEVSFRLCASRYVPCTNPRKRAALAVVLLSLAGCGGGGGGDGPTAEKIVRGDGYRFAAPAGWAVGRNSRVVQVSEGIKLVSVTRYPLVHAFRPALWDSVVRELDRVARGVAQQQEGNVASSRTITVSNRRARSYDIEYERDGKQRVERITFVLRGKTEYYLLCRYEGGDTGACDRLLATFTLAG